MEEMVLCALCFVLGALCFVLGAWCFVLGALYFVLCTLFSLPEALVKSKDPLSSKFKVPSSKDKELGLKCHDIGYTEKCHDIGYIND